ncbi:transmembrane protein 82 isoform X2 [Esox lucius]|uniref:transmembrane protein 82 isoform X2 n=1 Tax=Esox lucius TaxID=8010 RepID=UPI0005764DB8|nr:transmembrane protein 82 isoform X2 [Esox lucius]
MLSFITWFRPSIPGWLTLDANPLDSLLQGFVGACGIIVFCNLIRVHLFLKTESSNNNDSSKEMLKTPGRHGYARLLSECLHFLFLTVILAVVGSRAASLVVLEFSLRAVSAWVTAGPESGRFLQQLLVQCQFSLGCALSCSLHFLHEGSPQRWLCLLLAAGLSWFLVKQTRRLQLHVMALYKLHSSQHYCGVCIALLTSGCSLLPRLTRALMLTFAVATVAAISTINEHFLSATEALRFWTPLTICYTLLVVYMQEEQHCHPGGQAVINTVMMRLGALMVLMLTVGRWSDVVHIFLCFLGEAGCLIPSRDLLEVTTQYMEEVPTQCQKSEKRRRCLTTYKDD